MLTHLRPAFVIMAFFTLLTGLGYPLLFTALAQVILPGKAGGSVITKDGAVVGSRLIGQRFTSDKYFHGRPSAAGADGYDASASSGSNLGPLSKKLTDRVAADVAALQAAGARGIPADAVTTSASGLDPHISATFAGLQVDRIAKARGLTPDTVQTILARHIETPFFGVFGEMRVNVLELNLDLDAQSNPPVG
ncbi:MAG: potassium-transporting ATPase subunit KdpC [Hyphomicrobiaceae bacterium]|nr:potassium-transporting ATPase subunit KdpC [Hyphomicrobiaceae bacterium]